MLSNTGAARGEWGGRAAKCWEQSYKAKRKMSPRGTGPSPSPRPHPLKDALRVLGTGFLQKREKPGVGLKRKENVSAA